MMLEQLSMPRSKVYSILEGVADIVVRLPITFVQVGIIFAYCVCSIHYSM